MLGFLGDIIDQWKQMPTPAKLAVGVSVAGVAFLGYRAYKAGQGASSTSSTDPTLALGTVGGAPTTSDPTSVTTGSGSSSSTGSSGSTSSSSGTSSGTTTTGSKGGTKPPVKKTPKPPKRTPKPPAKHKPAPTGIHPATHSGASDRDVAVHPMHPKASTSTSTREDPEAAITLGANHAAGALASLKKRAPAPTPKVKPATGLHTSNGKVPLLA